MVLGSALVAVLVHPIVAALIVVSGMLFAAIDAQREGLGVVSYGISMTTLEEVYPEVRERCGNTSLSRPYSHGPAEDSPLSPPHDSLSLARRTRHLGRSRAANPWICIHTYARKMNSKCM